MTTQLIGGLVLRCDLEGRLLSSVGSAYAMRVHADDPRPLPLRLDGASAAKGERFLARVRGGGAFGWELCIAGEPHVHTLLFAGLPVGEQELCIVAAESPHALLKLLEQQSAARQFGADTEPSAALPVDANGAGPTPPPDPPGSDLMDELTRVNNQLVSLQRELAKRNAELVATTKQRNELLAAAAHDLRNPLLVMQGYCDLLGLGVGLAPGTQRELVGQVQDASELMLHILEDTLEYARLESGRILPHPVELDIVALTQKVVQAHRPLAQRKQIELVVDSAIQLPRLCLDATHLQQVIGNLLSNAIKYSHPGGRVDVVLTRAGEHVELAVRDHGQGISAAELHLLFRPFQTTSTRPTAGEPSAGLGLAIVQKLVQASGGEVSARSTLHEGSTFTVRLPLARATTTAARHDAAREPAAVGPPRRDPPSSKRHQN